MSMRIVIVYHSGSGHTAAQARAVLRGAQSVDEAVAQLISVTEVEDHWSKTLVVGRMSRGLA
jgi:NAD(P)H dehydrogenase (quinone)